MTISQNTNSTGNSQLERANARLKDMAKDITPKDQHEAAKAFRTSKRAIEYYVAGDRKDLDMIVALIDFFKGRIKKRDKILAD